MKNNRKLRALTEGALFIALALVLDQIDLFTLPDGGSINLLMVPIFFYCARWGFGPGMLVSFVFSVLKPLLGGAITVGWQSLLGDYIVAFTLLGLAGLFHRHTYGYFIGTVVGCLARFLVAYIVGVVLWGVYMPDTFFGMTMTSPWIYSAIYNGSYIAIDMILCLVVGAALYKPLGKYIRGEDLKKG